MKGLIHIYCGEGKGKTTAVMGLALRGASRGKKVMIIQFLKDGTSGEISLLSKQENVIICAGKATESFSWNMTAEEKQQTIKLHNSHLEKALAFTGDMLILDELCGACTTELLDIELVKKLIATKPEEQELVFTGRNPPQFIIEKADYITEMKMIKHPFEQGIPAREGIEY